MKTDSQLVETPGISKGWWDLWHDHWNCRTLDVLKKIRDLGAFMWRKDFIDDGVLISWPVFNKKTVLQWLFSLWRLLCIHWLRIGMYDIDISYLIYVIGLQLAHEFRIPSLDTKTSRFMSWFPWWVLVEVEPAQLWYVVIQGCREKSDFMQLGRSGAFRGRRTSCTTQKEEMKDWGQWNRGFE